MPARAPDGYATERERGAVIVALPSVIGAVRGAIRAAGTLHAWAASQPGARAYTGRGTAWGVGVAGGDWVVRHYRRGGAVARALDDRYLRTGTPRPLRELRASDAARRRGVSTPEVLAAVVYPAGAFYRADLATRLVPDGADLAEVALGPDRPDGAARERAWRAAGALLRVAWRAGVEHRDLNLRNILIQHAATPDTRAFLLDLDRAAVRDTAVARDVGAAMLARLHRSRRKLERRFGVSVSAGELQALDEGLGHG